jgi:predicted transcriptional regulator
MTPADLYPIVKKLKISQVTIAEETGYSKVYISRLMNGHIQGEKKFHKLLIHCIAKRAKRDYVEFKKIIEGTEWENYLP